MPLSLTPRNSRLWDTPETAVAPDASDRNDMRDELESFLRCGGSACFAAITVAGSEMEGDANADADADADADPAT